MNPAHLSFVQEAGYVLSSGLLAGTGLLGFFLYRQSHRRERAESALLRLEIQSLERKIKLAQQRYAALADGSREGILVVLAEDLSIVEANAAARRMTGMTEGVLPNLPDICQLALPSNEAPPQKSAEWFTLICRHRHVSFVRKDGGLTTLEVDAAPAEFDSRPAFQFFLREVTDRAQLEEQLRQAQKLSTVGHMVCSIAHELCNPLAVVNGYAEILLEKDLDASVRAQLEKVKYEANRASKLVRNFLTYSHQRPVKREPMNLNTAVDRALEILALEIRDACAETVRHLDARLPKAIADVDQVQQILVNLVHNSLQAIGNPSRTPRLAFTTYALDEKVVLKIEDNGPGIPKEIVGKIFEPYFTTKPAGVGTGLGLSIAHNIMTEHNGRIYYTPSHTGGAGFVLEFPRAAQEQTEIETIAPPTRPKKPAPNNGRRILILDDQDTIAELLAEMVRLLGHNAVSESDPQRALERVEDEEFDVILSDYRMPGMNGQEFYRAAIAIRPSVEGRIIFLTGDLMNEDTQEFLKDSGAPYLRKPFHMEKVEAAIVRVLKENGVVNAD